MTLRVRKAEDADIGSIFGIAETRSGIPEWSRNQFAEEVSKPRSRFLVAEESGEILGYALVWILDEDCQLLMVAVRENRVGRGVGRLLLDAARDAGREAGAAKMTLEVGENNNRARRVYDRAGFRVVGRRAKYYNDGSDAILMDASL